MLTLDTHRHRRFREIDDHQATVARALVNRRERVIGVSVTHRTTEMFLRKRDPNTRNDRASLTDMLGGQLRSHLTTRLNTLCAARVPISIHQRLMTD